MSTRAAERKFVARTPWRFYASILGINPTMMRTRANFYGRTGRGHESSSTWSDQDCPKKIWWTCTRCWIRPVLDYASSVYYTQLTGGQSNQIERLQRDTLNSLWFSSILSWSLRGKWATISAWQEVWCFDTFCRKLAPKNNRFSSWLPRQEFCSYDLRKGIIYVEKFASTERLRKSWEKYWRR